jgi:hypothetical protein
MLRSGVDAGWMDEGGMCGRVVPPSLHTFSHPPPNSASQFGTSHRRGVLRSRLRSRNPDNPRDLTHDGLLNPSLGLTRRLPCRRCGQSHWPHPTAVPAQGIVLQHSAGESCAGRRLLYVSMWFDNRTVTNFCLHASIVPVGPSGGPLFDRPKRGRKKPPGYTRCG